MRGSAGAVWGCVRGLWQNGSSVGRADGEGADRRGENAAGAARHKHRDRQGADRVAALPRTSPPRVSVRACSASSSHPWRAPCCQMAASTAARRGSTGTARGARCWHGVAPRHGPLPGGRGACAWRHPWRPLHGGLLPRRQRSRRQRSRPGPRAGRPTARWPPPLAPRPRPPAASASGPPSRGAWPWAAGPRSGRSPPAPRLLGEQALGEEGEGPCRPLRSPMRTKAAMGWARGEAAWQRRDARAVPASASRSATGSDTGSTSSFGRSLVVSPAGCRSR